MNPKPGSQKCSAKTIWPLCKSFKIKELAFQTVEDEFEASLLNSTPSVRGPATATHPTLMRANAKQHQNQSRPPEQWTQGAQQVSETSFWTSGSIAHCHSL